jgi:signal peptide peptidase SppA
MATEPTSGRLPHALDRVLGLALQPWAVTRDMLPIVARVLSRRLAGLALDDDFERRPPAAPSTSGSVAVIPIHGCIAPRMNLVSDVSGGATFEQAAGALRDALAADVKTIILDIDSPGGSVLGASEFARRVLAARTVVPVIAVANFECCSAAYWFASCATEVIAAPSACIGSIGVYAIHEDLSAALDDAGVKLTYISAGKYKIDGIQGEPLTDTARARLENAVNAHYGRFVGDVAKGRGVTDDAVRSGFGEGAVLTADDALAAGMIDRIATFDDVLARYVTAGRSSVLPVANAPSRPAATDPSNAPAIATGHDRIRQRRDLERALRALEF